MLRIKFLNISYEIALMCMLQNPADDVNIGSGNGITWANVDPDMCCHMASLGHKELKHQYYVYTFLAFRWWFR